MQNTSFLKDRVLFSPLASQSILKPRKKRSRSIAGSLMLTSLVDAFSILVIFLMMNSASDSSDFTKDKNIELPKASQLTTTLKTTVVKISKGILSVNDQIVRENQLGPILVDIQKNLELGKNPAAKSLVILADKDLDFSALNPIIMMGSRAGFSEFKFAVEKSKE